MKKILATFLTVIMLVCSMSVVAFADSDSVDVYVTIANEEGSLVLAQEKITVTDIDNDDVLTINDALYAAHEAKFEGGAAAGYSSAFGQWGLSLTKLWGIDNGGSYGYYVNNQSAWSLEDVVADGDYINAFIYTDLTNYSDMYCFFNEEKIETKTGDDVTVELKTLEYDLSNMPVEVPVVNATITVNGTDAGVKTDADGKATFKINESGRVIISATSSDETLIPPVCVANVATSKTAKVYVTISNDEGKLVMTQDKVTVSDVDKDGALTINDALYAAHEEKFEGGAAAGYASSFSQYGLGLSKLWGIANGGSYGYYVNNQSAWSLEDEIADGDYINAFVYTDLQTWSDTYCFFDVNVKSEKTDKEITLTLTMNTYDQNYAVVAVPVANATITINGEATNYVTDDNGKVTLKFDAEGEYVISAASEDVILIPPVCKIMVEKEAVSQTIPAIEGNGKGETATTEIVTDAATGAVNTADNSNTGVFVTLVLVSALTALILANRKESYEK